jgi:hypothetical protein
MLPEQQIERAIVITNIVLWLSGSYGREMRTTLIEIPNKLQAF